MVKRTPSVKDLEMSVDPLTQLPLRQSHIFHQKILESSVMEDAPVLVQSFRYVIITTVEIGCRFNYLVTDALLRSPCQRKRVLKRL